MGKCDEEASRAQEGQIQGTVEERRADQFGQNIKQESRGEKDKAENVGRAQMWKPLHANPSSIAAPSLDSGAPKGRQLLGAVVSILGGKG